MNVDRWRGTGRPKKDRWVCVTNDMKEKKSDSGEWKKKRVALTKLRMG